MKSQWNSPKISKESDISKPKRNQTKNSEIPKKVKIHMIVQLKEKLQNTSKQIHNKTRQLSFRSVMSICKSLKNRSKQTLIIKEEQVRSMSCTWQLTRQSSWVTSHKIRSCSGIKMKHSGLSQTIHWICKFKRLSRRATYTLRICSVNRRTWSRLLSFHTQRDRLLRVMLMNSLHRW